MRLRQRLGYAIAILFTLATSPRFAQPAATPPIRMLVPGFTVRELPVALTNTNNLEYTPDGRLWALGYDGRIHILTDTDRDGLEDHDQVWWSPKAGTFRGPIGWAVRPEGVYVSSKGKVSLVRDTNNDGTADSEEIVTTGWKEITQNVDAVGLAFDSDNNLYFSLGCANYANAYLLDKDGKPHYDIHSERGTILRLSPDHQRREILATGVRFAIGMAFNRFGDLFFTDQEGDTWTKGNHLDELNVLTPGPGGKPRHYGFPERHPDYLPDTIDEPPIVSFGPQHQSTCGLKFNERTDWRKPFGPAFWENDALIAGESRGKIWRTTLVKTPAGYVGRATLIARIPMLLVDVAVSPTGDLVACCHSGPPDWGTGPTGKGKLFKISYTDPSAPQPVLAWAAAKDEIRVGFDKPIDPSALTHLTGLTVTAGEYVRAADRLESMRPPYEVVKLQLATPRRELKIQSARLLDGNRTLLLATEPMPWRSWYAATIPGVKALGAPGLGDTIDVDFQTSGVKASWKLRDRIDSPEWQGYVPHIDPAITAAVAKGSAEHAAFFNCLAQPGELTLTALLDLPLGVATLTVESNQPLLAQLGGSTMSGQPRVQFTSASVRGEPLPFRAEIQTGGSPLVLTISYHTDADPTERPIPLDRLIPPDLPAQRQPVVTKLEPSPLLAGGDWRRGQQLFFGNQANCAACHSVSGKGATIGPDLTNLIHVSPESVLDNILHPSATINPDYAAYTVTLQDTTKLTGVLQPDPANPDQLLLHEALNKSTPLKKSQIKDLKPSPTSLMPEGFQALGDQNLRDLLTFLTTKEPKK